MKCIPSPEHKESAFVYYSPFSLCFGNRDESTDYWLSRERTTRKNPLNSYVSWSRWYTMSISRGSVGIILTTSQQFDIWIEKLIDVRGELNKGARSFAKSKQHEGALLRRQGTLVVPYLYFWVFLKILIESHLNWTWACLRGNTSSYISSLP